MMFSEDLCLIFSYVTKCYSINNSYVCGLSMGMHP
jgi:hypothetical protein